MGRRTAGLALLCALTGAMDGHALAAAPGDNGRLVFSHVDDGGVFLHSVAPDGSDERVLTDHEIARTTSALPVSMYVSESGAVWSPDGSQVLFASNRSPETAGNDLYVINADGSDLRRLPGPAAIDEWMPSWSPDGGRVVFSTTDAVGEQDIWTMNLDGAGLTQLTSGADTDSFPDWSPDGRQILFQRSYETDGEYELILMTVPADGSAPPTRLNVESPAGQPAWSPDGRFIAFAGGSKNQDIYVARADGSKKRLLTPTNPGIDGYPAWSPDGRLIAFHTARRSAAIVQILTVPAFGALEERVVVRKPRDEYDISYDAFPDWQRLPDRTAPRLVVRGVPRRCASGAFTVRAGATDISGIRRLGIALDGKALATTKRAKLRRRIAAHTLRAGRHKVTLNAVDRAGNRAKLARSFRRCG